MGVQVSGSAVARHLIASDSGHFGVWAGGVRGSSGLMANGCPESNECMQVDGYRSGHTIGVFETVVVSDATWAVWEIVFACLDVKLIIQCFPLAFRVK